MAGVQRASRPVLMLDYDGTLAPFVVDREKAFPYPGIAGRMKRIIEETSTRIIIVTGRTIEMIDRLLQPDSSVEIWGSHGAEHRLPSGEVERVQLDSDVSDLLASAVQFGEAMGETNLVESKPSGVAFHWRGCEPSRRDEIQTRIAEWWGRTESPHGVYLAEFDGGLELRVSGIDKGSAVEAVLDDLDKNTPLAYLGDDQTDEDAFGMIGSRGLKVLVRAEERETSADIQLVPPDELYRFLDRWSAHEV